MEDKGIIVTSRSEKDSGLSSSSANNLPLFSE